MDRLWTPWRYDYVSRSGTLSRPGVPAALSAWSESPEKDRECVFCNMIAAIDYAIANGMPVDAAEEAAFVLFRGQYCFLCLNAFPYATGHTLIVPYVHLDSLATLDRSATHEMIGLAQHVERALRVIYHPSGINIGMNLGEAAGAGIADHLHMHALPRWVGDTNFMTVVGDTRVLPETLDITWGRLRTALREQSDPHDTKVTTQK